MREQLVPYTELEKLNRQRLAETLPLSIPYSMHIEPTNICNFRCISCPQKLANYKSIVGYYEKMELDLYKKILLDIRSMGRLKALKLFGYGEPTLHPDLGRMVMMAREMDVCDRIEFTSNVTKLDEKLARELICGQLDYLRVSIYATDVASHSRFTGSNFPVNKIYRHLELLKNMKDQAGSSRPFIYIKIFDFMANDQKSNLYRLYSDIADEIAVEITHNMSGYDHIEEKLGIDIPIHTPRKICPLPFYMSAIGANGDVTVCCIDWSFSAKVGNIRKESLRDIWFGKRLQAFRRLTLEGRSFESPACRNCTWNWNHPDDLDDISQQKIEEILRYYESS
jgi:radical SAM protein with 4Fe4S-binding SPASM domain